MSLEGTLETIALPDVLALLSVTTKTGELRVEADGGTGSLWLDDGRVAGFDVGKNRTPVDAFFSLLRMRSGTFRFHTDGRPVNPVEPLDVGPVLEEAESRLIEWPSIVAVVPSLMAPLKLNPGVKETVVLTPEQWALIATIGSGRQAGDVLDERELGEFDGCKALKELVDLDLVRVDLTEGQVGQVGQAAYSASGLASSGGNILRRLAAAAAGEDAPEQPVAPPAEEGRSAALAEDEVAARYGWEQDLRPGSGYDAQLNVPEEDVELGEGRGDLADEEPAAADAEVEVASGIEFTDDVWHEEGEEMEAAAPEEVAEPEAQGETVNRGLLLKFLGSARN